MNGRSGFTLVELMVVVSLAALLLTWGLPAFSAWNQQHKVEGQMAQLYSDLQYARIHAYGVKVPTGLWWDAQGAYHISEGGYNANGTFNPNATEIAPPVTPQPAVSGQQTVSFDGRGLLDPNSAATFWVASNYGSPTDCVTISLTNIALGKMHGGNCQAQQ